MATIDKLDKVAVKALGQALLQHVQSFAKEHGLVVDLAGGTFDVSGAEWVEKLRFRVGDADKRMFEQYAGQVNLQPDDYGREFQVKNITYKVSGLQVRTGKVIGKRQPDGAAYAFNDRDIRKLFGREWDWEKPGALSPLTS